MTVSITTSGISLDGPLVAGEKVAVTVSGISLAAEDKPTLALLARFPDALLASAELTESDTPGKWMGELDTATKQTALFFATARADERRDAALELVAGRASIARLTVPMANSALCPKPDDAPFASPVYVPVPGPPGSPGTSEKCYVFSPSVDGETFDVPPDAGAVHIDIVPGSGVSNVALFTPSLPADKSFAAFVSATAPVGVSIGGFPLTVSGEQYAVLFSTGGGYFAFASIGASPTPT